MLDVTDNPIWNPQSADTFYVSDGELTARTALLYSCPATATVGTAITLSAPAGTSVIIDGAAQGAIDATGSEQLTFSDAGTYDLALSLWPYLDASFQVVVA